MDNPLQAYQLLKRLTVNWNKIELAMTKDSWHQVNKFVKDYRSLLPSQDDLNGAALALIRLQDTYNLTIPDMANGYIYGQNSLIQMSGEQFWQLSNNQPVSSVCDCVYSQRAIVFTLVKMLLIMAIMAYLWNGSRKPLPELTKKAIEQLQWMK